MPRNTTMTKTRSAAIVVAVSAAVFSSVVVIASAITTKPTRTDTIKTTLQIKPPAEDDQQEQSSFAARFWQQQQEKQQKELSFGGGGNDYGSVLQPPHKLSEAQQAHILEDIRRHNQQQQEQWLQSSTSSSADKAGDNGIITLQPEYEPATDQLQELLQINGVAAEDDDDHVGRDDDRHGKQRSVGIGGASDEGWQPQPPPTNWYNRQHIPPSPLSPYVSPPSPATIISHSQHVQHNQPPPPQQPLPPPASQQQQKFYSTPTTTVEHVVPYHQHQQHQLFVTSPPSATSTTSKNHQYHNNHQQQQYVVPSQSPQPGYYPQQSAASLVPTNGAGVGDETDTSDIEQQIRQQLTAVVGGSGGNYTILGSPTGVMDDHVMGADGLRQQIANLAASNDHLQYVKIGGDGSPSTRHRVQQPSETTVSSPPNPGNKNTIVKTVVIRQKPSPPPATTARPTTVAASVVKQQPWTVNEQQQLEQLARQVLPPGVAQYEIIPAGGVDGMSKGIGGDAAAAENAVGDTLQQPSSASAAATSFVTKKKPVTFVILEERPDGTVRVRGVEKKQHGSAAANSGPSAVDDEQLQQLVDRLNKGELRLPSAGISSVSKATTGVDSVSAASTTPAVPIFIPTSPTPVPPSKSGSVNKNRDSSSHHHVTVKPKVTTASAAITTQQQQKNFFLPTTVPTAGTAIDDSEAQQHQQHRQQQQNYPSTSSTPLTVNTTSPYNNNNNNKKPVKEGTFSSVLRRRGYYAMAKYMRQAGVDAVLDETGPFTVFVPTDKAFRALLVQLGGPDRAEDKFRENPRLLIGLLLHHVVPGAFKAVDLMAGDEMTGVSLAGTQLRANLYARQLYDNRWNDIEVLTVNGARVLDDVNPATSESMDDGFSPDDNNSGRTPQQRRDMVLSPSETVGNQQIMAIAHAVDRVLFPLPVGDVLATMKADRQRRYTVFVRAVEEDCSPGVRALLTGSRTVTLFAPMDDAFRVRRGTGNHTTSGSIADELLRDDGRFNGKRNRRKIADRFVLSHAVLAGPGDPPMYTAGLRFYQVRDTAYRFPDGGGDAPAYTGDEDSGGTDDDRDDGDGFTSASTSADGEHARYYQLTVYKDSGRIRLNGGAAQVVVRNVPATNGVLHGLDAPLV